MTRLHAPLAITSLVVAVGCGSNGPYDVGLIVKSSSEVESITKTYREVTGKGVQESSGVLGTGEVCSEAMSSAGNRITQWVGEDRINVQVVGETKVPVLVPDDSHDQEEVWVSLVMETTRSAGTAYTSEKRNFPGEDPAETTTAAGGGDPRGPHQRAPGLRAGSRRRAPLVTVRVPKTTAVADSKRPSCTTASASAPHFCRAGCATSWPLCRWTRRRRSATPSRRA